MRLIVRWGVAISVSLAVFVLAWWVCQAKAGLDEGAALGVAGAALAVVLAVSAWWVPRQTPNDFPDDSVAGKKQVRQSVRARRDAYVSGRDMTVDIHRRPGD